MKLAFELIEVGALLLLSVTSVLIIFTSFDVAHIAALWGTAIYMHILRSEKTND